MLDTSYCDCLKTLLPPILCLKAANVQSLPLYLFAESLWFNLGLTDSARIVGQQTLGMFPFLCPQSSVLDYRDLLLDTTSYQGAEALSSGPHVCAVSTLLTEPSP